MICCRQRDIQMLILQLLSCTLQLLEMLWGFAATDGHIIKLSSILVEGKAFAEGQHASLEAKRLEEPTSTHSSIRQEVPGQRPLQPGEVADNWKKGTLLKRWDPGNYGLGSLTSAPTNVREHVILEVTSMHMKHKGVWEQPAWIY
ncbi:hypothetical protein QYF61_011600 [Mycteria americana]|uniref:Uncharacterized protein n=1 Tax=Mycteria americana TaxID=33587 RepID=A0AAN7N835_MYCAM|nr:hypothetical protein QYF61_011600 [Mycteria americana]